MVSRSSFPVLTNDACFGAPVYNPISRRLQGVITPTTLVKDVSPLLSGLINHAARTIGERMLDLSSSRERVLLEKFLIASRQSKKTAVVGGDILLESPGASEHLRNINQHVLWATISESITARHPRRVLHFPTETSVVEVLCSAVVFNDQVIGAIIEVLDAPENHDKAGESVTGGHTATEWVPLAKALPGTSPAWVSVLDQAEAAMKAKIPVVVFGAPGSGKTTLLLNMLERTSPDQRPLVLDAVAAEGNADAWVTTLQQGLAEEMPLVIKHINTLDDGTARRTAETVLSHPRFLEQGLLHGTSSAQGLHLTSEGASGAARRARRRTSARSEPPRAQAGLPRPAEAPRTALRPDDDDQFHPGCVQCDRPRTLARESAAARVGDARRLRP